MTISDRDGVETIFEVIETLKVYIYPEFYQSTSADQRSSSSNKNLLLLGGLLGVFNINSNLVIFDTRILLLSYRNQFIGRNFQKLMFKNRLMNIFKNLVNENVRKQKEFRNFKVLLSQSLRWEKAQAIRAFISHLETNPS